MRTRLLVVLCVLVSPVWAADPPEIQLSLRAHRFVPAEVEVPTGTKIKLVISNDDATPEEFESHALNREKVVAGNSQITIFVGPLNPGRYPFFGEFHADTAQGALIVR